MSEADDVPKTMLGYQHAITPLTHSRRVERACQHARRVNEQRTDCSPSKADNHGDVTGHTLAQGQPMVTLVPPNIIHDLEHCTNSCYQLHVDHGAVQFESSIQQYGMYTCMKQYRSEAAQRNVRVVSTVTFVRHFYQLLLSLLPRAISIQYRDLCFNIAVGFRVLCVATRTVMCNSQSGLFSFHRIINNNRQNWTKMIINVSTQSQGNIKLLWNSSLRNVHFVRNFSNVPVRNQQQCHFRYQFSEILETTPWLVNILLRTRTCLH